MTFWRRVLGTLRGFVKAEAASQLAFDLKPRPIAHPGSHGGRGYYDSKGQWQYGERPAYVPSKFWAKHPEEAARHKEHYEAEGQLDPHIREYERTGKPVEFEVEGGKRVNVLHKIPRKGGGHRITHFDEAGPSGHSEHDTIADAVKELRRDHHSGKVNQGHLDRWTETETWARGMHQVHHAKVWNEKRHKWFEEQHDLRDRGEITQAEYDRRYKQFQDEEDADFERTKALFKSCLLFLRAGGGQLGFNFGAPRKPVQHPGVLGGRGYYDAHGVWQYGERPVAEAPPFKAYKPGKITRQNGRLNIEIGEPWELGTPPRPQQTFTVNGRQIPSFGAVAAEYPVAAQLIEEHDAAPEAPALTPAEPYERDETIDGVPTVIRQGSPDDPFKYRSQFHVTMAYDAEGYPGESRKLHAASLDEYRALLASRQPNPRDAAAVYAARGTRSPFFKAWFGDWEADPAAASKVVKVTGEPQETYDFHGESPHGLPVTMYHGTSTGGFTEFDPQKPDPGALYGPGFYFTEDKAIAEGYARGRVNQEMPDAHAKELARFVRKHLPEFAKLERRQWKVWNLGGGPHHQESRYALKLRGVENKQMDAVLGTTVDGIPADIEYLPKMLGWDTTTTIRWKQLAMHYGWKTTAPEVKACYLNIRRPFDGDRARVPVASIPNEFIARHPTLDMMPTKGGDAWERWVGIPDPYNPPAATYRQLATAMHSRAAVNDLLRTLGYDGITHIGGRITGHEPHRVWIAFKPEQVKAVDNVGTFDPAHTDIFKHRLLFLRAHGVQAQLGLFRGKARKDVEHPGIRGAQWWLGPHGNVVYKMPALTSAGRLPIEKPHAAVMHFRSGGSDVTTMAGYVAAGVPIGVDAQVISGPARKQLARYVQQGGQAFIDSGAFSAFRAMLKGKRDSQLTPEEFTRTFDRYDEMVDTSLDSPSIRNNPAMAHDIAARWHLSAPDVIGDQAASLAALEAFAPRVTRLQDKGVSLLVPLQRGDMSLAEYHQRALKALGGRLFVSALPSNEAAVPFAEIMEFVQAVQPMAVHLLGIGEPHITEARRRAIQAVSPHTVVTSDSNRLAAIVGEGRPFTETVRREAGDVLRKLQAEAKRRRLRFDLKKMGRQVGPPIRARVLATVEGWTPAAA